MAPADRKCCGGQIRPENFFRRSKWARTLRVRASSVPKRAQNGQQLP
jgi:hypothetical protein